MTAKVVRTDLETDTALLRVSQTVPSCVSVATATLPVGSDVYVIGSPLGAALSNSLTKGIVSGYREAGGVSWLQTDASVSPGNSGGGAYGVDGMRHGVIGSKLVGEAVEGIAFAADIGAALTGLGIHLGDATDANLAVVVDEPVAVQVPAPLVGNRPAKPHEPPKSSKCEAVDVTTDAFSGATHLRGTLPGLQMTYDGGDAMQLKVKWTVLKAAPTELSGPNVSFDISLADGTAVRLYAKDGALFPNQGAAPGLDTFYDIPRDTVSILASSPWTQVVFRTSETNVNPMAMDSTYGKVYAADFACFYVHMSP